jgi:hypothetical protein
MKSFAVQGPVVVFEYRASQQERRMRSPPADYFASISRSIHTGT